MNVSEKIPVLAEKNSLTVWAAAPEVLECQPKRIPGFQAGILWRIWSNPGKIYWRNLRKITAWTTGNNDVEKPVNITERNQGKKFMGNINNNSCRNLKKKLWINPWRNLVRMSKISWKKTLRDIPPAPLEGIFQNEIRKKVRRTSKGKFKENALRNFPKDNTIGKLTIIS